jgi:hypothetical protein
MRLFDIRVVCAAAYRRPNPNRPHNPSTGPARRLATHMMAEFFAQPILSDRPALNLVVDNDRAAGCPSLHSNPDRSDFEYGRLASLQQER